jgi:hypothetical protein
MLSYKQLFCRRFPRQTSVFGAAVYIRPIKIHLNSRPPPKKKTPNDLYESSGFEILTEEITKVAIFWDIARCSQYVNRRFGGTYHLHLQHAISFFGLLFDPEDGDDKFLRNIGSYMYYRALYPRRRQHSTQAIALHFSHFSVIR